MSTEIPIGNLLGIQTLLFMRVLKRSFSSSIHLIENVTKALLEWQFLTHYQSLFAGIDNSIAKIFNMTWFSSASKQNLHKFQHCYYTDLPKKLVDALFTKGALQQSVLHFSGINCSHSWVTKPTNTQTIFKFCLRTSLSPQPTK